MGTTTYNYYASLNEQRLVFAPDIIVNSQGLSCGDKVSIAAYVYRGNAYFNIQSEGCMICHAVSQFLLCKFYGQDCQFLLSKLNAYKRREFTSEAIWIKTINHDRSACVQTVVQALEEALKGKVVEHCEVDFDKKGILACDACVNTFALNWGAFDNPPASLPVVSLSQGLLSIMKKVIRSDNNQEISLQRLGKISLNKTDQDLLQSVLRQGSQNKLIKKLRLSVLYYNNAIRHQHPLTAGNVVTLARKQIISKHSVSKAIEEINQYIHDHGLKIFRVKGVNTATFYPPGEYRTHLDYDYIGNTLGDTFRLMDFLLNEKHFGFVTGGSVPFSLKVVADQYGNELLTGHLHLEKIIQDRYQLIVDINIGGFPLGRSQLIRVNNDNGITVEEQVLITVSHLFKHDIAYIKDINDVFYMLRSDELSIDRLLDLIEEHNMMFEFYIIMRYMLVSYPNTDFPIDRVYSRLAYVSSILLAKNWPYSRRSHGLLKLLSTAIECTSIHGILLGFREFRKQVLDNQANGLLAERFTLVNRYKYTRTYLYPLIIFNCFVDLAGLASLGYIAVIEAQTLYRDTDHQMLITNNGIFMVEPETSRDRELVRDAIEEIMHALGLSALDLKHDYFLQARRDLWLY